MTRDELIDAMQDMLNGWEYIRQSHGDLYGVGWDRAQNKIEKALAALSSATPAGGGLVMVPVASTYGMDEAGLHALSAGGVEHARATDAARCWEAMIAAALAASPVPMSDECGICHGDPDACDIHDCGGAHKKADPVPMSDTGAQEVNLIECGCGDMYRHETYGAGYIDAIGKCQNCAAADASPPPQSAPQDAQCPMCHGKGWHWMPWADLAGVEPPPPKKVTCTQCTPQASQSAPILNCPKCGVRDGLDLMCVCPKREASQSAPGEAEVWQECDDNGKPIWSDSSFATSRDDLENPRPLYTHPATTHSAPVAGMSDEQIAELSLKFVRMEPLSDFDYVGFARAIEAAVRETQGGRGEWRP